MFFDSDSLLILIYKYIYIPFQINAVSLCSFLCLTHLLLIFLIEHVIGREREYERLWFTSQLSSSCLHECGHLFNQEKGGLDLRVIKHHIALIICYNYVVIENKKIYMF